LLEIASRLIAALPIHLSREAIMHRRLSQLLGSLLVAGLALGLTGLSARAAFAQDSEKKLPAPSKEDQAKAQELVQSLFKDELAKAKTDKDAAKSLAATFLKEGEGTKDDPAARFVLYRQAAELAARAGDMDTALQALEQLAKEFEVNAAPLKADVLASAVQQASGKEAHQELAETALRFIKEAVDVDDLETAGRLAKVAEEAATQAKSLALLSNVRKRHEEVKLLQKEQERVKPFLQKLKDKEDDAEANGEVGKYYCLLRGLWGKGLPLLAKGPDGELKTLAHKDLGNPKATKAQVALGDGWWDLSEKEKPPGKWRLQERAAHWYEQALPDLTGLAKIRLEKRVEEVRAHSPGAEKEPVIKVAVGEIRKFTHGGVVYQAAVSKDGKRIVSASSDNTIRVWDVNTGKQLRQLIGHNGLIRTLAISPDGKRAVSGCTDQTCRVWDLDSGKELFQIQGHTSYVYTVAIAPDGKTGLSVSSDGAIRQWDIKSGKDIRKFQGHTRYVSSLSFSADGKRLLSSSADGTMRLWDVQNGNELRRFDVGGKGGPGKATRPVYAALSGDGKVALSATTSTPKVGVPSDVWLWDAQAGKQLAQLSGHTNIVYGVALSPDGRRALTSARDNTVRLWDVKSGKEIQRFDAPLTTICRVAFLANGRMAISTHNDGTIRLWGLPK
jgi:WD40 repeat protein